MPRKVSDFSRAYWKDRIITGIRRDGTEEPISRDFANEIWVRNHLWWEIHDDFYPGSVCHPSTPRFQ